MTERRPDGSPFLAQDLVRERKTGRIGVVTWSSEPEHALFDVCFTDIPTDATEPAPDWFAVHCWPDDYEHIDPITALADLA